MIMEIQLSEKQVQILQQIAQEKQSIQNAAQTEWNKVQKREDDVVFVILDSKNIEPVPGMKLEGDKLIIPDKPIKKK